MSTRDVAQRLGCIRSSNQPGVRRNVQQSSVSLPQASKTVVSSTLAVQRHGQTTDGAASALPSTSATDRSSSTRQTDPLMAGAEKVVCNGHSKCSVRMSQLQKWPLSQSANKSSGECSVCHAVRQLHISNGTVHRHGPRHNPCHGSDKPPAAVQSQAPSSSCHDTHASAATASNQIDVQAPLLTPGIDSTGLTSGASQTDNQAHPQISETLLCQAICRASEALFQ